MDVVGWALIGIFAFFALLFILFIGYFLLKRGSGSIKFEKKVKDAKSIVTLQPFVNLKRATVQDKVGGEDLIFVRENISSGEKIVFEYPASNTPVRLTCEGEANVTMEAKP